MFVCTCFVRVHCCGDPLASLLFCPGEPFEMMRLSTAYGKSSCYLCCPVIVVVRVLCEMMHMGFLASACSYFGVDPNSHTLKDSDGTCWPSAALVLPSLRCIADPVVCVYWCIACMRSLFVSLFEFSAKDSRMCVCLRMLSHL